jgi:hypothetical protein
MEDINCDEQGWQYRIVDSGEKRYRWSVVCEKHGAMSPRFMTKKQAELYVNAWGIDWCVEGEE